MRKRIFKVLVFVIIFFLALIISIKVLDIVHFKCIFRNLFNIYCVGCGTTRMLKCIFKLKFKEAFMYNPLVFILLILFLIYLIYFIAVYIKTGKKVGNHIGLMHYTIGQRRGLDIGGTKNRMFVVGKDLNKNILYIESGNDEYLITTSCVVDQINWTYEKRLEKCTAKFRYRQKDVEVSLKHLNDDEILVKYPQGVKSVTPGQACVFYEGDICLGGGIIKEVRKNGEKLWYL